MNFVRLTMTQNSQLEAGDNFAAQTTHKHFLKIFLCRANYQPGVVRRLARPFVCRVKSTLAWRNIVHITTHVEALLI